MSSALKHDVKRTIELFCYDVFKKNVTDETYNDCFRILCNGTFEPHMFTGEMKLKMFCVWRPSHRLLLFRETGVMLHKFNMQMN